MNRLTIFAKGNLDVRDSLHSQRLGGEVGWNGINPLLREAGFTARVRHETWARSDALVAAAGEVPAELAARALPLAPFTAASQFSTAVFEPGPDVVVLSIQPDVFCFGARHRDDGWLFHAHDAETWAAEDRAWLRERFEPLPLLGVDASMANLAAIVERIRERADPAILVYNVSAVVPGEQVHCHAGLDDTLATRIRRFNLALTDLSRETGVSIVDVDAVVARAGADRVKLDALHLSSEGCALVAGEVVRVLKDLGCLGEGA